MMNWRELLSEKRPGRTPSGRTGQDLRTEFEKDYHRIIVSASFRRLQDKTQVFPLDKSDFIRTRLTHSLEAASIGRSLGANIGSAILRDRLDPSFDAGMKADLSLVLECAGLVHDIGNPPFGHFGEDSIREWFRSNLPALRFRGRPAADLMTPQMKSDFCGFEGNAQGLRLVSKLDYPVHQDGLNLTFGLLGAVIKYPVSSVEADPASGCAARRKFGYFYSEKELFGAVEAETGAGGKRNPLAFILEAADDIAYATADIEDAFRKGFFDFPTFTHELRERGVPALWRARLSDLFDLARLSGAVRPEEAAIRSWLREMQDELVTAAANSFIAHYDALMEGRFGKELLSAKPAGTLLAALKSVAYDYAFTSMSIYKTEIAANRILTFLLDHLVPAALVFDEDRPGLMEEKYLSLIPENYARVCRRASADADDAEVLYARIQMAADTVCGMTDSYAKDLYTELTGFL